MATRSGSIDEYRLSKVICDERRQPNLAKSFGYRFCISALLILMSCMALIISTIELFSFDPSPTELLFPKEKDIPTEFGAKAAADARRDATIHSFMVIFALLIEANYLPARTWLNKKIARL